MSPRGEARSAAGATEGGPRDTALGSTIRSYHLTVARTARYCTLGPREGPHGQLWLACHGYGQLAADLLESLRAASAPDRLLVAPEALSRFYVDDKGGPHGPDSKVGGTWMTREDRLAEIEDYVAYLDLVYHEVSRPPPSDEPHAVPPVTADPVVGHETSGSQADRVVALGFSQGTATVSRWAARTGASLAELVLWGGRLPPELDPAALSDRWRGLRVTLVAGTRDRWFGGEILPKEEAKLRDHGIHTRVLTFDGGHRLDDRVLAQIADDV